MSIIIENKEKMSKQEEDIVIRKITNSLPAGYELLGVSVNLKLKNIYHYIAVKLYFDEQNKKISEQFVYGNSYTKEKKIFSIDELKILEGLLHNVFEEQLPSITSQEKNIKGYM